MTTRKQYQRPEQRQIAFRCEHILETSTLPDTQGSPSVENATQKQEEETFGSWE